jgi:hypothetical protein
MSARNPSLSRLAVNIVLDGLLGALAVPLAYWLARPERPMVSLFAVAAGAIALIAGGVPFGLATQYWRFAGLADMSAIAASALAGAGFYALLFLAAGLALHEYSARSVRAIFGDRVEDMLSGYKVLSRRFVKSFPVLATGFDIETELAVHALELALPIAHVEGDYRPRPAGSESKLRTWRDGWRILRLILRLLRHERPLAFFGALGGAAFLVAAVLIAPVIATYLRTGLVPRLPTAVLATGIVLAGALSLTTGIILDTVTRGRRETRLLAYLRHAAPGP